jgi:peptidyl-prolyl cis-trans isomerase C
MRLLVFGGFMLVCVLAGASQASARQGKAQADGVAARIAGQTISRADVLAAQDMMPAQYRRAPAEAIYGVLLEEVVDSRLLAIEARKARLHEDPALKRRLARVEEQILREAYVQQYVAKQLPESVQRKKYDELVASIPRPEEVRARHILVKTKDEADAILKQVQGGADFAQIAKEKSTDGTAAEGGDLGYFTRDQMLAPFVEAAFALKPGDLAAAPVETEFGWHVIKVEDKRLAVPPSFEDIKDELLVQLSREQVLQLLKKIKSDTKIEYFNFDGTPRAKP